MPTPPGPGGGWPAVMCHGFPYDVHAFAEAKADTTRFCRYLKVARLEDLPHVRFQAALAPLEAKSV